MTPIRHRYALWALCLLVGALLGGGFRRWLAAAPSAVAPVAFGAPSPVVPSAGTADGVRPAQARGLAQAEAPQPASAAPAPASNRRAPIFHPRAAGEWQGMPVMVGHHPECESAETCGLALACVAGQCGPCTRDVECASGEVCALDHCVIQKNLGCRARRDCRGDELCVLSGYSPDPRNNGAMTSACLARHGVGRPPEELVVEVPSAPPPPTDWTSPGELMNLLEQR